MKGRVVSVKMQKSAVVLVENPKIHPLYKKVFKRSKRYLVNDQIGVAEGDIVEIIKIKPISKNKHFSITKVLGKDIITLGTQAMKDEAAEAIEEVLPEAKEDVIVESEAVIEEPKTEEKTKNKSAKRNTKKKKEESEK